MIVNTLFLKSRRRIELVRLILVWALRVCRLMERTLKVSLRDGSSKVVGWHYGQSSRATFFTMTTELLSVIVRRTADQRILAEPLDPVQEKYSQILGLSGLFSPISAPVPSLTREAGCIGQEAPHESAHPPTPIDKTL